MDSRGKEAQAQMPALEIRAKVFISCGQQDQEMDIVDKIKKFLHDEGYTPYVARRHHSLKSLRENVFRELDESEYFLYIDFKREELKAAKSGGPPIHRGSLFTNQELAIASFLDLDPIGFQQQGVKKLDGMMQALQLNCEEFESHDQLFEKIQEKIKSGIWRPNWSNKLCLCRDPKECGGSSGDPPRIFHVDVKNLHLRKTAIQCRAYLDEIVNLETNEKIPFDTFQLKWAGTTIPDVNIRPKKTNSFDAFYIKENEPTRLQWMGFSFADTEKVCPNVNGPGKYLFTFVVVSHNFPEVRTQFILDLREDVQETSLTAEVSD